MKRIYLIGIPIHGNIGDAAIVLAEEKFINDNFKDYQLKCILDENIEKDIKELKKEINEEDIILLHGGGNIGDEYIICENRRRMIIQEFPNNKIIVMPQSIYFNNTDYARKELQKTKEIYNQHKDLTIIAREKVSLEIMKKELKNVNVILTPDIVMYLDKTKASNRQGVLFAMREDLEKVLTDTHIQQMKEKVSKYFDIIVDTDTHLGNIEINDDIRKEIVEEKWSEFRNSELVITDRLHGMIFAAITSTPCIALGNYNHKIESSYEWLKEQGYIKFIKKYEDIENAIIELKKKESNRYNNEFAIKEFKKIINIIKNIDTI